MRPRLALIVPAMDPTAIAALRDLALHAARAGGAVALSHFRQGGLRVERKGDDSPVTVADRQTEGVVRALLGEQRPDDGWLGEETGSAPGSSGLRWIVDPIDGTRNFVRGIPLWSTLVACVRGPEGAEQVVAAAAGFPALPEWYDAGLGLGARRDGEPLQVSACTDLGQAGLAYYTYEWFRRHGWEHLFRELSATCELCRGGGDAYMHMLVASGRMDCCVEPGLAPWDLAATSLIVAEAGGRVTDFAGRPGFRGGNAILSNGHLHAGLLARVAAHGPPPAGGV